MEINLGILASSFVFDSSSSHLDLNSGHWLEDKASGMGRLDYQNGDYYEGQWELDRRHGINSFRFFLSSRILINIV